CSAQTTNQPDPFTDDSRLEVKQTIRAVGISFPDFLAELSAKTGIRFTADRNVAEDKITLFAHDRLLSTTLRAVARFFNFSWRREGEAGAYSYVLYQGVAQRKAEEREIDEQLLRAADRILSEIALLRKAELMTPDERLAQEKELGSAMLAE